MIVAGGLGVGGEEVLVAQGFGGGSTVGGGPSTPTPYGRDLTVRIMRDDIASPAREAERIDA